MKTSHGTKWLAAVAVMMLLAMVGQPEAEGQNVPLGPSSWVVDDVVFEGGERLVGWFEYDPATNEYTNVNLRLVSGTRFVAQRGGPSALIAVEELRDDLTGVPVVGLFFDDPLDNAGGIVAVTGFNSTCFGPDCELLNFPVDKITSGQVSAEWLPPRILSSGVVTVEENSRFVVDIAGDDDEDSEGSGLTYAVVEGADAALFEVDASTGVVQFITAPDFEAPTDADGNNMYAVQVELSDSLGAFVLHDVVITVTNVEEAAPSGLFIAHGLPTWDSASDGFAIASNADGEGVMAGIKGDGKLYIRRFAADGSFGRWVQVGRDGWGTGDVAIDSSGRAEIVAVKNDGRLYTRSWLPSGSFGPWVNHGESNWAPGVRPSVTTNGSVIYIAAVKADGRLYTRRRDVWAGWDSFSRHGVLGWTQTDIAIASDGDTWLAGTQSDGRLLFATTDRGNIWSDLQTQGSATWSPDVPPSVSARAGGAAYAAVKTDGRLYTREFVRGRWRSFVSHGQPTWAAAAIDVSESGQIALIGVKQFGALYTRTSDTASGWGAWRRYGFNTWSTNSVPAVTAGSESHQLLAVKASGHLYTRVVHS